MNKWEEEIWQDYEVNVEEVLKKVEKQYKRALADIDRNIMILQSDELTQSRIYRIEHQKALRQQVAAILDKLHSDEYATISQFLTQCYTNGFVGAMYSLHKQSLPILMAIDPKQAVRAVLTDSMLSKPLYDSLGVDIKKLKRQISAEISRGIAGGMSYNDIARNISWTTNAPMSRARTIVRTEAHRITQASHYDAATRVKDKGVDIVLQWDASLDGDTRDTHRMLDGTIIEVGEYFESNGNKARYPGDFGDPAEDCNCRCVLTERARSALDEDELKTLQERAEFFGLDKTKNLEEFREKYLKAVENLPKSGIIKERKSGALSGAYNDENDPTGSKREKHANLYYEELRNSSKDSFVAAVSGNASIDSEIVKKAYSHIFEDKHLLDGELRYFDPDYYMAESFRRLRTNADIQPHDIILLRHEALEYDIMKANPDMSYEEAHGLAAEEYDYKSALIAWLMGGK